MPWTNPERLSVGESVGGASGAGILKTDANGLLLDPATIATADIANDAITQSKLAENSVGASEIISGAVSTDELANAAVTLAKLANLANATVIGRNTAGTGVPEAVTMAQLAALLQGQSFSFSVLQTFAAAVGLTLTPGAAPGSPVQGQMWFDSTRNCPMYFDGTAARPVNEVGTWTPSLTFATPGDLSVAYTTQVGRYRKYGRLLWVDFRVITSTFNFTTATGALQLGGLPFTMGAANEPLTSLLPYAYAGIIAGASNSAMFLQPVSNTSYMLLRRQTPAASAASSVITTYQVSSFVTGTQVTLTGSGWLGLVNES